VLAAVLNAMRRTGRQPDDCIVGQVGLGAAGIGIVRLLRHAGARRILGTDLDDGAMKRLADLGGEPSTLGEIMKTADIVIATTGVRGLIRPETVRKGQIIMALSNPDPEIEPSDALAHGAAIAADGKGINNVLAFPGLFKGALEARAPRFTDAMLLAAAGAIAELVRGEDLVPDPLDRAVHEAVAAAVSRSSLSGA
jgi:malate dehydrogenase (oxaloacetate-decarboxylating)